MSNPKVMSNVSVLGDGTNPSDSAHVTKGTPVDLKRKEFKETKQFGTDLNAGFHKTWQTATRNARNNKNVRPLGGQ
jgi:hypothetical protein